MKFQVSRDTRVRFGTFIATALPLGRIHIQRNPLLSGDECDAQEATLTSLESDPERYLAEHTKRNLKTGKNRVVFMAGGNAAGKSSVIVGTKIKERAQAVLDSTFSNPDHAQLLVTEALSANKRVTILYVFRPLEEAFHGMLNRAAVEGRTVSIDQLVRSTMEPPL